MLYVTTENTAGFEYHIGEPVHSNFKDTSFINKVTMVQADCNELDTIRFEINNIISSRSRVQRWFGDDAKFIWSHFAFRK